MKLAWSDASLKATEGFDGREKYEIREWASGDWPDITSSKERQSLQVMRLAVLVFARLVVS